LSPNAKKRKLRAVIDTSVLVAGILASEINMSPARIQARMFSAGGQKRTVLSGS
jgi:hypothetical protein